MHTEIQTTDTIPSPPGGLWHDIRDAIRGTERSFVETSIDGHPARSLSFDIPGDRGLVGDSLLTLVGNRLYVVAAIRPRRDPHNGLLARLLKTFTVWAR